jgi:hypothetical protein
MDDKWSKYYPANYTAITPADIEMIKELHRNPPVEEDNTNDKSDDGEEIDKVQPKALKKKFDDRKDKDIDNDGDEDDSDEVIHAKRKAISKNIAKQEEIEVEEEVFNHHIVQGTTEKGKVTHSGSLQQMQKTIRDPKSNLGNSVLVKTRHDLKTGDGWKKHMHAEDVAEMSKDEYKDDNMKKQQAKKKKKGDPEEVEFSKKQDTVTNMESVESGKGGPIDLQQELLALAKTIRGKDKLALEGAAKLIKQRAYGKLAPYLDNMEEEPRQSVLMILMNDQKIADKVMKKMKTESYHGWLMAEMTQKYDGLTWTEIGERLIKTPERRLVALAYATKMGTIDAPSPEVQRLADECELEDLEKAAGSIIDEDDELDEAKSEGEKIADKNKADNAKKAAGTNQDNQSDANKADQDRETQSNVNDKEQDQRMAQSEKERAAKKKQQAIARSRETDDPTVKKDGGPSTMRSKLVGIAHAALEDVEEVPETIDARRRVFKEKLKKLAYEKAKEMIANRSKKDSEPDFAHTDEAKKEEEDTDDIGSKIKETGKVNNTVKTEPTVKESAGVSFVRKYKEKKTEESKDIKLDTSILEYLAGSSFGSVKQANPVGAEFASDDAPASATSIARALKCSPQQVQKMLDDMVEAGTVSRVGDAYSYASPRPAEPLGKDYH